MSRQAGSLFSPVTCFYQDGTTSGGKTGFHVCTLVTDHPGMFKVDSQFVSCLQEHAGERLATVAVACIRPFTVERVVGTVVVCIHFGATGLKLMLHVKVELLQVLLAVIAAPDAGLVGNDYNQIASSSQQPDGLNRSVNEAEILRAPEVLALLVYRPVPVEEDRTA